MQMTKVILTATTVDQLRRALKSMAKGMPADHQMIPALYWSTETKVWAHKRGLPAGGFEALGPPTHTLGPRFTVAAIERDKADPSEIAVADGQEIYVKLPPDIQELPEVCIDFGYFIDKHHKPTSR
jgi:hypothetical protein